MFLLLSFYLKLLHNFSALYSISGVIYYSWWGPILFTIDLNHEQTQKHLNFSTWYIFWTDRTLDDRVSHSSENIMSWWEGEVWQSLTTNTPDKKFGHSVVLFWFRRAPTAASRPSPPVQHRERRTLNAFRTIRSESKCRNAIGLSACRRDLFCVPR